MVQFQQMGNAECFETWRNLVKTLQSTQDPAEKNKVLRKVPAPPVHLCPICIQTLERERPMKLKAPSLPHGLCAHAKAPFWWQLGPAANTRMHEGQGWLNARGPL